MKTIPVNKQAKKILNSLPIHTFPRLYTHANRFIIAFSCAVPSCFHNLHSHATCTSCCGKKNAPMKYGYGEKAAKLRL